MHLFEKNGTEINIYEMKADNKRLFDYKQKEMTQLPLDERILRAVAKNPGAKLLQYEKDYYLFRDLNGGPHGIYGNHTLDKYSMTEQEIARQAKLLKEYYNGKFRYSDIREIYDYDESERKLKIIKYWLLTQGFYHTRDSQRPTMDNIIQLPKSLYLLYLLEKGNFHKISDQDDISEQLKCFDIQELPNEKISIAELCRICYSGLVVQSFESAMENVETTQRILRQYKK